MTTQINTAQPEHTKSKSFAALSSVGRWLRSGMTRAADIIVPPQCVFCGIDLQRTQFQALADEILLCNDCRESFVDENWVWCERCGSSRPPKETGRNLCWKCAKTPPRFDAVVPLGRYRDELRRAVLRMKQSHYDHVSTTMGYLYSTHRANHIQNFRPDIAVPVPMHWMHQIGRGTNSAEILSVEIARKLGISPATKMLTRCRKTIPQKDLSPENRARNVRGAFRITTGYDIHGARVLLVDDILTTGATCNEIAGVLKRAGAHSVIVAVIARAEGPGQQ